MYSLTESPRAVITKKKKRVITQAKAETSTQLSFDLSPNLGAVTGLPDCSESQSLIQRNKVI